jgi:hypothetical protein
VVVFPGSTDLIGQLVDVSIVDAKNLTLFANRVAREGISTEAEPCVIGSI